MLNYIGAPSSTSTMMSPIPNLSCYKCINHPSYHYCQPPLLLTALPSIYTNHTTNSVATVIALAISISTNASTWPSITTCITIVVTYTAPIFPKLAISLSWVWLPCILMPTFFTFHHFHHQLQWTIRSHHQPDWIHY